MIRIIFIREIQEFLKSTKFMVGFILSIVLVTLSTAINLQDYNRRRTDYEAAVEEAKSNPSYRIDGFRRPEPLSIFVRGKDRSLGNKIMINSSDIPWKASGYMGEYSLKDATASGLEAVDLDFIIRVVLSLLVIFLTYDSISGEKSRGTLKLMLAGNLPRSSLLIGKFSAVFVLFSVTLLCCFLTAVLAIIPGGRIAIGADAILRLGTMYLLSLVYLVVFIVLGMLVSIITNTPSSSLAILLQAWIFIVLIYPNLAVQLAGKLAPVQTDRSLQEKLGAVRENYLDRLNAINLETNKAFAEHRQPDRDLPLERQRIISEVALASYQAGLDHQSKLDAQAYLAERFCRLCPSMLFSGVMKDLAGTGIGQYAKFLEPARTYWDKVKEKSELLYKDREAYLKYILPEYDYPKDPFRAAIRRSLPEFLILISLALCGAAMAFAMVSRKDAR